MKKREDYEQELSEVNLLLKFYDSRYQRTGSIVEKEFYTLTIKHLKKSQYYLKSFLGED